MIDFWNRFRRDRLAVYSLGVIALFVAAAILASLLAPYDPSA
jgi:ABC-type antimicrobial peptide transport system permease subunit